MTSSTTPDEDTGGGPAASTDSFSCTRLFIKDTRDATGVGLIRLGNGPVLMSNVLLATAFLTLARKEIGCYTDDDEVEIECGKIYGFKPTSLLTNIGVVSGVLTALFMPVIGAIVDCTTHRRTVGYVVFITLLTIQAIQIGTVQSTWFPMTILQAINGFLYLVQHLAGFSYYPEIARDVGLQKMVGYSADYQAFTFGSELIYLIVTGAIAFALSLDNISTAQLGQALCVAVSGVAYVLGWHKYITNKPASRTLAPGENLLCSGFLQVFRTFRDLWKYYRQTVGFYLLAVMFGQSGANAFYTVAVTYLTEVLNFGILEIIIIFIIVLASSLPGSYIGAFMSRRSTPIKSILLNIFLFIGANFAGFLLMTSPDDKLIAYIFAAVWGCLLGWFFPTDALIFSMIMPKGQESELAGFYLYCGNILGWLPNLIFTIMNEADLSLSWAGIHLNIYFAIAALLYIFMAPWDECVEASKVNLMKGEESGRKVDDDIPIDL